MAGIILPVSTFLITVIISGNCQQPAIYFSVTEEEANAVIGNISTSEYIRNYNFEPEDIGKLEYEILEQNNVNRDITLFQVDMDTGVLSTAKPIDREEQDECHSSEYCSLILTVKISGVLTSDTVLLTPSIEIEILDINDNPPEFEQDSFSFQITENVPIGTKRELPEATDMDSPDNGVDPTGYELQSDVIGLFELTTDEDDGLSLEVKNILDREVTDSYDLKLMAYDKGQPERLSSVMVIRISVNDRNDEAPKFPEEGYQQEIREDFQVNSTILKVEATDADIGVNAVVKYKFEQGIDIINGIFGLDSQTGDIYLKKPLDYEQAQTHEIVVVGFNEGSEPKSSSTNVLITVIDVNDEIPVVKVDTLTKRQNAEVQENLPANTLVALIIVADEDAGNNGKVTCSMVHRSFQLRPLVDEKQFKVTTTEQLDRESQSSYSLEIVCLDSGSPSLQGTGRVNVTVLDDNDHDPEFSQAEYQVTVAENSGIGAFVVQVSATDEDIGENGTVSYSISDPAVEKYVEIDQDSGILKTAKRLDYEQVKRFTVLVKASDNGKKPRSSIVSVQIEVTDENDQPPEFENEMYVFDIKENSPLEASVGTVQAHDIDSAGNNAFVYSIGQSGDASSFAIDSISGRITTADLLDRELKDQYNFLVYATDQKDGFLSTSVTVTANILDENDNKPRIIYPVGKNNLTIEISNHVPVGHRIMQITAQDADVDQNANLSYFLYDEASDSRSPRFVIDRYNGEITTNKDLTSDDYKVSAPRIVVKDNGQSPKSASTTVTIIIDSSLNYLNTGPTEGTSVGAKDSTNTYIIVILTIVTILIVAGLITGIFCLKRRKFKSAGNDAVKDSSNSQKAVNLSKNSKTPHMTAVPKSSENVEKNESFSISTTSGNIPIVSGQPNAEVPISNMTHSPGGSNVHGLDTTGSDDTLPSNADSGKGPSEGEADIGVMRVDSDRQRPINRRAPPALDLASARPEVYFQEHAHLEHPHHRQPQSAGPYPSYHHRHNNHPHYQVGNHHMDFQSSPTRLIPEQECMSRSYPNSPNESEYVAPYFNGPEFNQWNPQHLQRQQHPQEMIDMQLHGLHHLQKQGFFNSHSIPVGSGTDSGYHSQNGQLSQSAPTETVFQGQQNNGHFNANMHADSGYSSQNGGFSQHDSHRVWGEQNVHPNVARQFSEPASSHHTYYQMDGLPVNQNKHGVDV